MTLDKIICDNKNSSFLSQIGIKEKVSVEGYGLWGYAYGNKGKTIATFHPAEENSGIIFVAGKTRIPAKIEFAKYGYMGVCLENDSGSINVIEHLMSALAGLKIDNAIVEIKGLGNICPLTDNYAMDYMNALQNVLIEQSAPKRLWTLSKQYKNGFAVYRNESNKLQGSQMTESEFKKFSRDAIFVKNKEGVLIRYHGGFPHKAIGEQIFSLDMTTDNYINKIACARSIGFRDQIVEVLGLSEKTETFMKWGEQGLFGLNTKNLLYVGGVDDTEYLNPKEYGVRYGGQEFIRHKILDSIGENKLIGQFKDVHFNYIKTGHIFNIAWLNFMLNKGIFIQHE